MVAQRHRRRVLIIEASALDALDFTPPDVCRARQQLRTEMVEATSPRSTHPGSRALKKQGFEALAVKITWIHIETAVNHTRPKREKEAEMTEIDTASPALPTSPAERSNHRDADRWGRRGGRRRDVRPGRAA